jgi:tetratricopeptide (TPR) repeat protein
MDALAYSGLALKKLAINLKDSVAHPSREFKNLGKNIQSRLAEKRWYNKLNVRVAHPVKALKAYYTPNEFPALKAQHRLSQADYFVSIKDNDAAEKCLDKVVKIQGVPHNLLATSYLRLHSLHLGRNDFAMAIKYIEWAKQFDKHADDSFLTPQNYLKAAEQLAADRLKYDEKSYAYSSTRSEAGRMARCARNKMIELKVTPRQLSEDEERRVLHDSRAILGRLGFAV